MVLVISFSQSATTENYIELRCEKWEIIGQLLCVYKECGQVTMLPLQNVAYFYEKIDL